MISLYGTFTAHPGKRNELVGYITQVFDELTDCKLYLVNTSLEDENVIHIFEVWESEEAHQTSLSNTKVKAAIQQALPLIKEMSGSKKLQPVKGSKGL